MSWAELITGSVLITDSKEHKNTLDPVRRRDRHGMILIELILVVEQHENPKKTYVAAGPAIPLNRPHIHADCMFANYRFDRSKQGITAGLAGERLIHHHLCLLLAVASVRRRQYPVGPFGVTGARIHHPMHPRV